MATEVRNPAVQCGTKRTYEKPQAKQRARVVGLSYYRCPWCEWWHLGHKPKDHEGNGGVVR